MLQGYHAVTIHEYGDATNGCQSTGGHFNPKNEDHGHPESVHRHVGDLGNIGDSGKVKITDNVISLFPGKNSIVGRSLVIHEQEDDYGIGGNKSSKKTGNVGKAVGCGIIGIKCNK